MKLIVGIGNPGKVYENTRHNIGFMVIDAYLGDVSYHEKFNALYVKKIIDGETVYFLKPLIYNLLWQQEQLRLMRMVSQSAK